MSRLELLMGKSQDLQSDFYLKSKGIFIKPIVTFHLRHDRAIDEYCCYNLFFPIYIDIKDLETKEKSKYQLCYSIEGHCLGIDVVQGSGVSILHTDPSLLIEVRNFIKKSIKEDFSLDTLINKTPFFKIFKTTRRSFIRRNELLTKQLKQEKLTKQEKTEKKELNKRIAWKGPEQYFNPQKQFFTARGLIAFIVFLFPIRGAKAFSSLIEKNPILGDCSYDFSDYDVVIGRKPLIELNKSQESFIDSVLDIEF